MPDALPQVSSNGSQANPLGVWPFVPCKAKDGYNVAGIAECQELVGHGRAFCISGKPSNSTSTAAAEATKSCRCSWLWHSPGGGDLAFDPRLGCTMLQPIGIVSSCQRATTVAFGLIVMSYGFVLIHRVRSLTRTSRSCLQIIRGKVMTSVINNVLGTFCCTLSEFSFLMRGVTGSNQPWYPGLQGYAVTFLAIFEVLAITTVVVQWAQISSNALAFRRKSSASLVLRSRVFVVSLAAFTMGHVIIFHVVLRTTFVTMALLVFTVIGVASFYLWSARMLINAVTNAKKKLSGRKRRSTVVKLKKGAEANEGLVSRFALIWWAAKSVFATSMAVALGAALSVTLMQLPPNAFPDTIDAFGGYSTTWNVFMTLSDALWNTGIQAGNLVILLYFARGIKGRRGNAIQPEQSAGSTTGSDTDTGLSEMSIVPNSFLG